jgi:type IV pilus assembly protein PilP
MTLVGSLMRRGQPVALIRIDRLVHSVRPGAYLGQNYGKVIKITDTQVLLREIVQDASGEWTERAASLQLQEERQ